jgi:CRP-like cAMP-binding protein
MWESIEESELFKGVNPRILVELAKECEELTFPQGITIFNAGDTSESIYELVEGSIDLVGLKAEVLHLTVSRAGQVFGWTALVEPYARNATAKCTSGTKVMKISRTSIEKIIENHPHEGIVILKNLMRIIAGRLTRAYVYIEYCTE